MKEIKREVIYIMLVVIIIIIMIYLHSTDLSNCQDKGLTEVEELEKRVKELEDELEAYRDNYTALWTTINSYHN